VLIGNARAIATLAVQQKLPSCGFLEFAAAGGLAAYGVNFVELCRRAAYFVDKILKGTMPNDLPVEQPTKFELGINLKTAKALGLTVPDSLLARAPPRVHHASRRYGGVAARGARAAVGGRFRLTPVEIALD